MTVASEDAVACCDGGFALIEVLVAFAITTLGLISFYSAFGHYQRSAAALEARRSAVAYARSHLESFAADTTISAGTSEGAYPDGTRWQVTISEMAGSPFNVPVRPYRVVLVARDTQRRTVVSLISTIIARASQ